MHRVPERALASLFAASAMIFLVITFHLLIDGTAVQAQAVDTPTPIPTAEQDDDFGVHNIPPLEGKLNPAKYPNLDSNLNRIVEQVETGQFTAHVAAANAPLHQEESVAVTLYVSEGYADTVVSYLSANGASPRNTGVDYIEAYIPVSLLADASGQDGVISVRTIIPPQAAQGTIDSGGAEAHGVPAWHTAGIKGQGVRIGVIDVGFQGVRSLQGTELPANIEARCYFAVGSYTSIISDCENDDYHGTAVTEAAFDIAPGATYYIANPISEGDLASVVDWMLEQDVDIINHSVGWTWSGPGNGTSPYTESPLKSVDNAVDGGVTWVNSAGNEALKTWFGDFSDTNGDGFHEFNGTDDCNGVELIAGRTYIFQIRWDDDWGGASIDLDLYLVSFVSGNPEIVDFSEDYQSGLFWQRPFELIEYPADFTGTYCLGIRHYGSTPDWLQLQAFSAPMELEYSTLSRSIGTPAESANSGLLAVGAASVTSTSEIEDFSSRGPTLDSRIKPDIVGADGGNSASLGTWRGTSQASPHVAGLAALVKQHFSHYSPGQIAQYLKDNAAPRGSPDPNNIWGHGFAMLPAPPVFDLPGAPVIDVVTADEVSIAIEWSAPSDTGGSQISAYDLRYIRADADETLESNWTVIEDVWTGSGSLQYTLSGLSGGVEYEIQVRAVNDAGEGPWSATESITTTTGPLSSDASLSSLTVRPVDITGFHSDVTEYHVGVANDVTQVEIIPTTNHPGATVRILEFEAQSGVGATLSVRERQNVFTVTVTAQDGSTTKTYTITIGRGSNAAFGWKVPPTTSTTFNSPQVFPLLAYGPMATPCGWCAALANSPNVPPTLCSYDMSTKERGADFHTLGIARKQCSP